MYIQQCVKAKSRGSTLKLAFW